MIYIVEKQKIKKTTYQVWRSEWSGDEYDPKSTEVLVDEYESQPFAQYRLEESEKVAKKEKGADWKDLVHFFIKSKHIFTNPTPSERTQRPDNIVHSGEVEAQKDICGDISSVYSSKNLGIAYLVLRGAAKAHYHNRMEEVYFVAKGEGTVTLGDKTYEISEGDTIPIPKKTTHFLDTKSRLEIIVITHPHYLPEDVITT